MTSRTLSSSRVLVGLAISASLTAVCDSHALPIFDAPGSGNEDCRWTSAFNGNFERRNNNFDGEAITVFVESDFAAEFAGCGANVLTQEQIEHQIQDAMEVWNREANGRVFVWGGTIDVTSEAAACALVQQAMPGGTDSPPSNTPAVIVHGHTDPNGGTAASNIANCPGVTEVQFKLTSGNNNSADRFDACSHSAAPKLKDWDNSLYTMASITGAMIHEFGHTLGLQHRHETPSSGDGNSGQSVMSYVNTSNDGDDRDNVNNASDLHLWQWDKDCVDDNGSFGGTAVVNERTVQSVYTNYPTSGAASAPTKLTDLFTKAGRSGGSGRASNNATLYALFYGTHLIRSGGIDSTSAHAFATSYNTVSGYDFSDGQYSVSPVFFSMLEHATSVERHRVNTLAVPAVSGTVVDPPWLTTSSDDGWFDDTAGVDQDYYQRRIGSADYYLQSHLPLMAAHDPVSDMTVFARVETTRVDGDDALTTTTNQIFLHVLDSENVLEGAGTSLSDVLTAPAYPNPPPAPAANFTYDMKTATQPGIACANDSFDPPGSDDYNCMIAWKDMGSPDGHILYTFFKVDPNATDPSERFEFDGSANILNYGANEAATPSDLSVAFFGTRWRVAYKTYGTGFQENKIKVIFGFEDSYSMDDGTNNVTTQGYVVDAPTWHYRATNPNKATTLSWTVDATL